MHYDYPLGFALPPSPLSFLLLQKPFSFRPFGLAKKWKKNFEIDSSQLLQSINNGCHCVAVVDMELMIGHEKNVLVKDAGRRMGWIYCKLLWVVDTTTNVILEPLRLTQDQITIAVRYYFTIYLPYPAPCRPSFALQEGVLCVSVCGNID